MRLPLILASLLALATGLPAKADSVTVFAAASLGDVLTRAAEQWQAQTGNSAIIVPASSAALARQIANGAPADVYVSASADWMEWLATQDLIAPASRRDIAGNALVLIAPGAAPDARDGDVLVAPDTDLTALLGEGRMAMAQTASVPAGQYGKQALEALGLWPAVVRRLAETDNVRAALALVALGETPLGVVYATDALAEPRVHVLATFPATSHAPIRYPAAVTQEAKDPATALAFLDWMAGPQARQILSDQGFVLVPE